MYRFFNNNPVANRTGDCAVRAVSMAINESWDSTYLLIALAGMQMGDSMEELMEVLRRTNKPLYNATIREIQD